MVFSYFVCPQYSFAATAGQQFNKGLETTGGTEGAGFDVENDGAELALFEKIGYVVRLFLSIVGVLFLILMIYGGFRWMKAMGNEQEVTAGRDIVINATIGLVVVMAAYAVTAFIGKATDDAGTGVDTTYEESP